jgi:AcrR family transcriptional regulator
MARTKAEDFDDKSQLILDTAADLFAARGFSAATTIEIAAACRMSKSALYHYHKSKEAILYALLSTHMSEVIQEVEQAVAGQKLPRARLRAFVAALLANNAVSRSKNITLLNETWALPPGQRSEIRRLQRKLVRIGTSLLEALNSRVMMHSALSTPYTMLLFGLVNWTYTWYEPKGAVTPTELADRITDLFLSGFPSASPTVSVASLIGVQPLRGRREATRRPAGVSRD